MILQVPPNLSTFFAILGLISKIIKLKLIQLIIFRLMTTINQEEIQKFSRIADEWWDAKGKFKYLRRFNPIRIKYIIINILFILIIKIIS